MPSFIDENIYRKLITTSKKAGRNLNVYEGQGFWGQILGVQKIRHTGNAL